MIHRLWFYTETIFTYFYLTVIKKMLSEMIEYHGGNRYRKQFIIIGYQLESQSASTDKMKNPCNTSVQSSSHNTYLSIIPSGSTRIDLNCSSIEYDSRLSLDPRGKQSVNTITACRRTLAFTAVRDRNRTGSYNSVRRFHNSLFFR